MAQHRTTPCAVCQLSCELEACVTDEHGHAVHESCYHETVSSKFLQQARELREVADQLIKRSDLLVEAYKQLTGQSKRPRTESN
jgi:hypothetical protein